MPQNQKEMKTKVPLLIDGVPAPEVARIGIARGWITLPPPVAQTEIVKFEETKMKEKAEGELPTFADRAETGEVRL